VSISVVLTCPDDCEDITGVPNGSVKNDRLIDISQPVSVFIAPVAPKRNT